MIDKSKLHSALKMAIPTEWSNVKSTSALIGDDHYRVVLKHDQKLGNVNVSIESTLTDTEIAGVTVSSKSLYKNAPAIDTVVTVLYEQSKSV